MATLNNELSKHLAELDKEYEDLLRPFLEDLANSDTVSEEKSAINRFENNINKYVKGEHKDEVN
ncbi:hypothetical protein N7L96_11100 [Mammaliicoccus sciuri]|uniref:Uncharacterized protein n=1 Tax=Mammaliicoccus sciuri TaxID=1296 RepID=A0AAJ4SHL9_MAMSC|nr:MULTISPECIES: hypothetical protein [Mammaliicoccus]MCD8802951.1 hypothetical protein [Mammaliicoccus sciuri]MCD8836499.1 hypothetical protein [Mammaliicoccus sciuri]MCJ0920542.1 hypothetical protein [Mammaliicoccus sciuri]MCJ0926340.1 hypothetical protein [Mammaliicoccus sciuri]MCJ0940866.1 hypothetical protein [Mammaliicoccus sciuri]